MTPSTTFQWPPSPSGTFQPVRSVPLKSDTKPGGGSAGPAKPAGAGAAASPRARARAARRRRPMHEVASLIEECAPVYNGTQTGKGGRSGAPGALTAPGGRDNVRDRQERSPHEQEDTSSTATRLPDYITSATPNPAANRAPWFKNTAPTYAGHLPVVRVLAGRGDRPEPGWRPGRRSRLGAGQPGPGRAGLPLLLLPGARPCWARRRACRCTSWAPRPSGPRAGS